jgi:hypothetical protein
MGVRISANKLMEDAELKKPGSHKIVFSLKI